MKQMKKHFGKIRKSGAELIRLDDLAPLEDVAGGKKPVIFGASAPRPLTTSKQQPQRGE